jgi:hypothetical protein
MSWFIIVNKIQLYLSFDKSDKMRVTDLFEKFSDNDQLFLLTELESSNVIIFFLTNTFIESDEFKKDWSKRGKKILIIVFLEEIKLKLNLNDNQLFVSHFDETMSLLAREKNIEKNKLFLSRIVNYLKNNNLNKKYETVSNSFSSKILNANLERLEVVQIELIENDEVLVKTINQKKIEKILIINWIKGETIGMIGNENIELKGFCWIYHSNQIFCYQKYIKNFEESKCSLFSKTGNLIKSVYSIKNRIYEVNFIFYNKNNFEIYLNVIDKSSNRRLILTLSKEFLQTKLIDEDLFNPDFQINFSSKINLFNIEYNMFHYDSNIAFLQYGKTNRNVFVFDKSSYSIIDSFQTIYRLIMVIEGKMILKSKSRYFIQKIQISKALNLKDCDAFCRFNLYKKPHLLLNPYFLPCGNIACLECIYHHYNIFKKTLKCEICNQEHAILEQLEPVNKSIIDNLFNQNLFNKLMSKNKNFISDIGN